MARVTNNKRSGYIDIEGREIIPCIYDRAQSFDGELANVEKEGKWGVINKNGIEILPCIYDDVSINKLCLCGDRGILYE